MSATQTRAFFSCGVFVLWTIASPMTSACGVAIQSGRTLTAHDDGLSISAGASERCIHGIPGPNSPYREELAGPVTDPELQSYLTGISPAARRAAVAAGIEPLLARVLREQHLGRETGAPTPAFLTLRQELADRVATLQTQLTAMEFECDCVRGLIHETLDVYAESETDRQLDLTVASLAAGASTGVGAAVWDVANSSTGSPAVEHGPLITSLVGAVATTALGAAVIWPREREIGYVHTHNILAPILAGRDPGYFFPTFLFRLLTLPTGTDRQTPREELLAQWTSLLDADVDEADRSVAEEILFGEGGIYDAQLLGLREELLQHLGATLDSFARDIDLLTRAIALALTAPAH